ncbi:MAG: transcriptional repressor LexA [bacterium]
MSERLTKRQREVLNFIVGFWDNNQYAPSYREIAVHFGLSSVSTIHSHVQLLKGKGYLDGEFNIPRALELTEAVRPNVEAISLPLIGLITAGEPIEAIEDKNSTVAVPADTVTGLECYALKVKGESMRDEGILDGDIVVVEPNFYPQNGQSVVALLNGHFATLKKFYREKTRVRLQPANSAFKPIYVRNPVIQGVVRAVIRKYR